MLPDFFGCSLLFVTTHSVFVIPSVILLCSSKKEPGLNRKLTLVTPDKTQTPSKTRTADSSGKQNESKSEKFEGSPDVMSAYHYVTPPIGPSRALFSTSSPMQPLQKKIEVRAEIPRDTRDQKDGKREENQEPTDLRSFESAPCGIEENALAVVKEAEAVDHTQDDAEENTLSIPQTSLKRAEKPEKKSTDKDKKTVEKESDEAVGGSKTTFLQGRFEEEPEMKGAVKRSFILLRPEHACSDAIKQKTTVAKKASGEVDKLAVAVTSPKVSRAIVTSTSMQSSIAMKRSVHDNSQEFESIRSEKSYEISTQIKKETTNIGGISRAAEAEKILEKAHPPISYTELTEKTQKPMPPPQEGPDRTQALTSANPSLPTGNELSPPPPPPQELPEQTQVLPNEV